MLIAYSSVRRHIIQRYSRPHPTRSQRRWRRLPRTGRQRRLPRSRPLLSPIACTLLTFPHDCSRQRTLHFVPVVGLFCYTERVPRAHWRRPATPLRARRKVSGLEESTKKKRSGSIHLLRQAHKAGIAGVAPGDGQMAAACIEHRGRRRLSGFGRPWGFSR